MVEVRDMISFIALRYLWMLASKVEGRLRISKQSVLRRAGEGGKMFPEKGWSVEEIINN